jgi:lipoprotein-anchoring transpeptidase ErfK/SrfK
MRPKTIRSRIPLIALAASAVALFGWQAIAEGNRVMFPNLEQLVHYTTVRRGSVTEHMLTTREAIEAVKAGQPIPNGSHVVLVDYREGEVVRYFVMQKGEGWGADYDDSRRTADWQFQWFKPDRTINMNENTARCQSCHQARADNEYLYTFDQMKAFD